MSLCIFEVSDPDSETTNGKCECHGQLIEEKGSDLTMEVNILKNVLETTHIKNTFVLMAENFFFSIAECIVV